MVFSMYYAHHGQHNLSSSSFYLFLQSTNESFRIITWKEAVLATCRHDNWHSWRLNWEWNIILMHQWSSSSSLHYHPFGFSPFPHFESLHPLSPSVPPSPHAPPQLSNCGEDGAMRCNYSNWLWLLHLHDKHTAVLGTNGLLSAPCTTTLVWSSQDPAPVGLRGWLWGEIDGDKGALALDSQEFFCCSKILDTPDPMKVYNFWKYFCPNSSQTRALFTFEFVQKNQQKPFNFFPVAAKMSIFDCSFFSQ